MLAAQDNFLLGKYYLNFNPIYLNLIFNFEIDKNLYSDNE